MRKASALTQRQSPSIRTTVEVQGARVHNLKNISVELPRDKLTVITGSSGSGKSSLAFDTVYAEGQRRYMESLSSYAKRFIAQVEKPDVDFVYGLSLVISIEQKTVARNPRSTVGTLTDISSYFNLLFATVADATCPYTGEDVPIKTTANIVESILSLPEGTEIELQAPLFLVYGEEPTFIFVEARRQGCRTVLIDDERIDLSAHVPEAIEGEPHMRAVVDKFTIGDGIDKQLTAAVEHALRVGDSLLAVEITNEISAARKRVFFDRLGSATYDLVYGDITPDYFGFNTPESACRTCGGIGTTKMTHPDLLITNPERSLREGCFLRDAFTYKPETHQGYLVYGLCSEYSIDLDRPWRDLSHEAHDVILNGTKGHPVELQIPPEVKNPREQ